MENLEFEVCVDSVHSALAAEKGGATRVELCSALSEGGLTPSAGLMELTKKQLNIPVHVLIRPRRGDFLYSDLEFEIMKKDILLAKSLGVEGVVLGILNIDGQVDVKRTEELISLAAPLKITFHRAFDVCIAPFNALADLMRLKVDYLLTSGQKKTALEGAELIAELIKLAGKNLTVMPGGGINEANIGELLKKTGASVFHASARSNVDSRMAFQNHDLSMASNQSLSEYENLMADANRVEKIRNAAV